MFEMEDKEIIILVKEEVRKQIKEQLDKAMNAARRR